MYSAVVVQEGFQRRWELWRWGVQWPAIRSWQWPTEIITEADPLTTTQEVAGEFCVHHSMVIWHLKQIRKVKKLVSGSLTCTCAPGCFSHIQLFATLWTITPQAPLSMAFSRQGYWSVVLYPPPGDLPDSRVKHTSLKSPALVSGFFTTSTTWGPIFTRAKFFSPKL